MSAATKRKHVANEILNDFPPLPDPPKLFVARIVAGRGNNLHSVDAATIPGHSASEDCPSTIEQSSLAQFLVSMPPKYRKSFWVKRGDYVLCQPIEEGDKVKAEIVRVLYKDDIKYIHQEGRWPNQFPLASERSAKDDADLYPPSSTEDDSGDESESDEKSENT